MNYVEVKPENGEYEDRLYSVYRAVNTVKEDLFLLDPSERAVLIKSIIEQISPKEMAMSMYYGNTTKATLIANLIRQEDYTQLKEQVSEVLK